MENAQIVAVLQAYTAGQAVESRIIGTSEWVVVPPGFSVWNFEDFEYRVKPLDPDTIDWSAVSPGFKWMARDLNGEAFLYVSEPIRYESKWAGSMVNPLTVNARHFSSYAAGPRDWRDSLVERPA